MFGKWTLYDLYNCEEVFQFQCPRQWARLRETTDPGIRFCDTCRKSVHYCATPEEFVRQGKLGRCVAIQSEVTIKRELEDQPMHVGIVSPAVFEQWEQERKRMMSWWGEVLELDPDLPFESGTLDRARGLVEDYREAEYRKKIEEAEYAANEPARREVQRAEEERRSKVRAELAKIEAMSDREAWGRVGGCPRCGFTYRWDGARCAHCGHPASA